MTQNLKQATRLEPTRPDSKEKTLAKTQLPLSETAKTEQVENDKKLEQTVKPQEQNTQKNNFIEPISEIFNEQAKYMEKSFNAFHKAFDQMHKSFNNFDLISGQMKGANQKTGQPPEEADVKQDYKPSSPKEKQKENNKNKNNVDNDNYNHVQYLKPFEMMQPIFDNKAFNDHQQAFDNAFGEMDTFMTKEHKTLDNTKPYYCQTQQTTKLPNGYQHSIKRTRTDQFEENEMIQQLGDRKVVQKKNIDLQSGKEDERRDLVNVKEDEIVKFNKDFDDEGAKFRQRWGDKTLNNEPKMKALK